MKRRNYTVKVENAQCVKHSWHTARLAIREMLKDLMKEGQTADLVTATYEPDSTGQYIAGFEVWKIGEKCVTATIQKEIEQ